MRNPFKSLPAIFTIAMFVVGPFGSCVSAAPLVAAGEYVSVYALDGGSLWASGNGLSNETRYAPASPLMTGRLWLDLHSTHGIDSEGGLWTWGSRDLGVFSPTRTFYPIRIDAETWRSVSANRFAVRNDGTLWGWGNHYVGSTVILNSQVPARFGNDDGWRFVTSAGYNLAIKDDGTLWAWGHNGHGNLGDGTTTLRTLPIQVGSDTDWASAACVDWTSFAIKTDGSLWAWGSGPYGDGSAYGTTFNVPIQVGTDINWRKIAGGSSVVLAIRTDGSLWSWGQSSNGMLGLGTVTSRLLPTRIGLESNWSDVAVGDDHVVASRTDGSIWAWGRNNRTQFGLTGITTSNVPVEITSAFSPGPDFEIERNGSPLAVNRATWTLGPAILGEPVALDILIRNRGAAPLVLSSGALPGFTITCPAQIPAVTADIIRIRLDATQTGLFSGDVAVNTNDPERPLFTLDLSGYVVSPTEDTDADGMKDAAEVALNALGFEWQSAQPSLVSEFYQNAALAGLYPESEVEDLRWQAMAPEIPASGETVLLPLEIRPSNGNPAPVLVPQNISQTTQQILDVSIPLAPGKRFILLRQP
jgi:alpha-tubulin suppressor-like RCC1 family protein